MINVSLVNHSTLFHDSDIVPLANALGIQVTRDFFPVWGVTCKIFYTPSGKNPSPDHWVLGFFDDSDQAGALGYHDITPTGQPIGKVFVRSTLMDKQSVSVTASHELCEMLGDPDINLSAEVDFSGRPPVFYAYEVSDPVESDDDGYLITIPPKWTGGGASIRVSDFVTPAYFESFRTAGPFDFNGRLKAPLTLSPGGYISYLDLGNLHAGWQQQFAKDASVATRILARPRPGSRRSRRILPRSEWLASTYEPEIDGTPVEI